jgi:hypothetical protein
MHTCRCEREELYLVRADRFTTSSLRYSLSLDAKSFILRLSYNDRKDFRRFFVCAEAFWSTFSFSKMVINSVDVSLHLIASSLRAASSRVNRRLEPFTATKEESRFPRMVLKLLHVSSSRLLCLVLPLVAISRAFVTKVHPNSINCNKLAASPRALNGSMSTYD